MIADGRRDLRYALRGLLKTPAFTLGILLTLSLGIGATAVIFTAIDAVLLSSAPVADSRSVVSIYGATADGRVLTATSSYPDYADLRDSGSLAGAAAFGAITLSLDTGGATEPVPGQVVTGNYFDVLGVAPAVGRGFTPDEDRPGAPVHVAVVSYPFWQERLGGDRGAIGRSITLNGASYTIVGVAPRGFAGTVLGIPSEVWVPMALQPEVRPPSAPLRRAMGTANLLARRGGGWLSMVGRLRDGTSLEQTVAALDVLARQIEAAHPDTNAGARFNVLPLGEGPGLRRGARPMLQLLGAAVILVLLIACANVASLLLVRAVSRRREVAVRIALGATRSQLVRQWLTESVLLALLASAGALAIAWWGAPALYGMGIPETVDLSVSARVVGFTFAVAVASGLIFGLAPVFSALRRDTIGALREDGRAMTAGGGATRLRSGFVVLQVALSLILLIGAGLFLRTLQNAYKVDLGYDLDQTLITDINLDVRGYLPQAGQLAYQQIFDRLEALPGVRAAGGSRVLVLSGGARLSGVSLDGRPLARDGSNSIGVRTNVVSHHYLAALGVPILRGRDFAPSDHPGGARVAIVSRSLAARVWPDADPIGQTLVSEGAPYEVIGVVPDAVYRSAVEIDPPPFYYSLLAQNYESGVTLHIRAEGDAMALVPAIRQAVREVDPLLALSAPRLLRDVFDRSVGIQRMMALLVGAFGALALLLAAIGLYGVMSHLAAERRGEMGLRLALGAAPGSILRLMLNQGVRLVALGAAIGLAGALAGARYVATQLFGIAPIDPATYAGVCLMLLAIGVLACLIPARRAMRVDPAHALRQS